MLDKICEGLRVAGHALKESPVTTEWGSRAVIVDPDGRSVERTQKA